MKSTSYNFYKNLAVITEFLEITDNSRYKEVPEDWLVVITDVIGSTKVIEAGKYKEVNIAGGITAMAIANVYKDLDFPFIFGGDGITFLIPGESEELIQDILADTREIVNLSFGLNLRVGLMRVREVYENGHTLHLAKLRVSKYYNQANISGDGLDWAEAKLKDPNPENPYLIPKDHKPKIKADFQGFTCRWKDIKSAKGETIAMIVKISTEDKEKTREILEQIFEFLQSTLGTEENYHPLSKENLKVGEDKYSKNEAIVASRGKQNLFYKFRIFLIKVQNWIVGQVIKKQISIAPSINGVPLRKIQDSQIISSDFRKYDGTLKMVISLSKENRETLSERLKKMYEEKLIFYGLHVSDRALMTCLLHTDSTREVHFIDAADGGYALAAKQMKAQMKAKNK